MLVENKGDGEPEGLMGSRNADDTMLPNGEGNAAAGKKRVGRPLELKDAVRKQVYMDDSSISTALKIGKGNLSEGVREALRRARADKSE
jgi:hypothetical protein